jgi:hypothetical protein
MCCGNSIAPVVCAAAMHCCHHHKTAQNKASMQNALECTAQSGTSLAKLPATNRNIRKVAGNGSHPVVVSSKRASKMQHHNNTVLMLMLMLLLLLLLGKRCHTLLFMQTHSLLLLILRAAACTPWINNVSSKHTKVLSKLI